MDRFVVYRRVSTKGQADSGLGLDAQNRDIRLYLENYSTGAEVLDTFTDILSGKTADRPELRKAIDLAKSAGATLLVSKLDRLSRRVSFIATLMDDKELTLKVAQMPYADKFQLHIYAALAEQERDFISRRTKAALAEAKARGVKLGGLRGKTEERNQALSDLADGHAQKVISLVRPLRDSGKTLQEIADSLNSSGITTVRGKRWAPTTVKRVLGRCTVT